MASRALVWGAPGANKLCRGRRCRLAARESRSHAPGGVRGRHGVVVVGAARLHASPVNRRPARRPARRFSIRPGSGRRRRSRSHARTGSWCAAGFASPSRPRRRCSCVCGALPARRLCRSVRSSLHAPSHGWDAGGGHADGPSAFRSDTGRRAVARGSAVHHLHRRARSDLLRPRAAAAPRPAEPVCRPHAAPAASPPAGQLGVANASHLPATSHAAAVFGCGSSSRSGLCWHDALGLVPGPAASAVPGVPEAADA
mmetsp:Transcript_17983/g.67805  ORF Transcript_17983/g.67805 Transcript_17983/m.67805 type:complete len:256 (-) Transcript_17983:441-1208(-)